MADDSELLLLYSRERSEAAFTELVQRHLKLVYFAALRQVGGDAHRAKDVSQAVFIQLALKAPGLASRASLAGWLYHCTRFVARRVMRGEHRRQIRERKAQTMLDPAADCPVVEWRQLGPLIDDALHALNERDRELILLRFFQDHSFVEISSKLGLSADAARFRLERALEKMRAGLAKRGLASTSAALALALATQAQASVPAGVSGPVVGAALAAQMPASAALGLQQTIMSTIKLKSAILALAAASAVGLSLFIGWQREHALRQELQAVQADRQRLLTQIQKNTALLRSATVTADQAKARLAALVREKQARQSRIESRGSAASGLKPGITALDALANSGQATPAAALQTLLWALYNGKVDVLARMMTFMPGGKDAATQLWASLPPDSQAQFPTPESLIALLIEHNYLNEAVGYKMVDEIPNGSPDDILARIQYQDSSGNILSRGVALRQIDGTWNLLLSARAPQALGDILLNSGPAKLQPAGK